MLIYIGVGDYVSVQAEGMLPLRAVRLKVHPLVVQSPGWINILFYPPCVVSKYEVRTTPHAPVAQLVEQ